MDLALALQYYKTFDNLLNDLQTIAMAKGFALRIHRSVRRATENHECGREYLRYDLSCVCAGKPKPVRPQRKRAEQATIKTDCPFEIRGIWRVQKHCWELETICNEHNHPPHEKPQDLCAHRRYLRRTTAAFELQVERLSRTGKITASAIDKELRGLFDDQRGDENMQITARDVQRLQEQNLRAVPRRQPRGGPPPRQDNSVQRDLSHDKPLRSQNNRGRGGRGRGKGRGGIQRPSQRSRGSQHQQQQEERLARMEEMLQELQRRVPPTPQPPQPRPQPAQDMEIRIPRPGEQMQYSEATAAIVERIRRQRPGLPPASLSGWGSSQP